MRIRKRSLLSTSHAPTSSSHIVCNPRSHSMSPASILIRHITPHRHPLHPHPPLPGKDEDAVRLQAQSRTSVPNSKSPVRVREPPADNRSLESEHPGKSNQVQALSISSVCVITSQISACKGERQTPGHDAITPQAMDTIKSGSDRKSEGRTIIRDIELENKHEMTNDTYHPLKAEYKLSSLTKCFLALRTDYKGKRTCCRRRRCTDLSAAIGHPSIGTKDQSETKGTNFCPVFYDIVTNVRDEGLSMREAMENLGENGHSKFFDMDALPLSIQVGRTGRSNPSVMEKLDDGKLLQKEKTSTLKVSNAATAIDSTLKADGQDEEEVSGKRCNRKDGRGWQCHRIRKMGTSYCEYHVVKMKANHERSAKKMMARKMSKKGEKSSRITSTIDMTTISERGQVPAKINSSIVESNEEGGRKMEEIRCLEMRATAGSTVSGAAMGKQAGGKSGERVRGERKRVKARSLKWIDERSKRIGGSTCMLISVEKRMMEAENVGGCCMLNSDPEEWRSDLFMNR